MQSNDTSASPPQHVGSTAELGELPEQQDIPADIAKVLADNLWDLYAEEGDAAEKRRLRNLRRRVANARDFPENTCPASRHLHLMASALASGKQYPMLNEEPMHCAETMLSVLESLWKARTELARLKSPNTEAQRAAVGGPTGAQS